MQSCKKSCISCTNTPEPGLATLLIVLLGPGPSLDLLHPPYPLTPAFCLKALADGGARAVVLHFNCLGRGGGHDAKKDRINATGLWLWRDDGGTDPTAQAPEGSGACAALGDSWG